MVCLIHTTVFFAQAPFKGEDDEEIFEAILEQDVRFPSSCGLGEDAKDLIRKVRVSFFECYIT